MGAQVEGAVPAPVSLDEAKAFLRVVGDDEDALIGSLIGSAAGLCEAFTGLALVARAVSEILPASAAWQRLSATPVRAVTGVMALPAEGEPVALGVGDYAVDIDANGDGWVRVLNARGAGRVRITYQAGQAAEASGVPEALRHGVLRLAAHFYTHRDAVADAGPPAVVSALWRPWRRMRIG